MKDRLSREELNKYWKKFKESNDEEARDFLITYYLFLVKHVVGRLASTLPSHVNVEDMYSTGIMGLMKAAERFDITMNNKFETYAVLLIRGAIIDEMRYLDWVPRSVHQKANQIEKAQHRLQQEHGRDPTDGEISKELGLTVKELHQQLAYVRPVMLISLDANTDYDEDSGCLAERIPDKKAKTSFEQADRKEFGEKLKEAVIDLPEQERTVLVLYYYENLMLKEIGKVMGVSESRISQIHSKALMRLRMRLKDFVSEFSNIFS